MAYVCSAGFNNCSKRMRFLNLFYLKIILTLVFLLVPFSFIYAQLSSPYNYKFINYTTHNGLVHNNVKKCLADSKGFLWIITENGLSRFDGYRFRNFQYKKGNKNGLPNNFLLDIAIDSQDRIWLTYSNGLCYFDQVNERFEDIQSVKKFNAIKNLAFDRRQHCLWLVCQEGLFKLDIKSEQITTTSLSRQLQFDAFSITLDSNGRLWIPIERYGYYVYNTMNNSASYFDYNYWPLHIFEDSDNEIWLSTWGSGFQKFDSRKADNTANFFEVTGSDALIKTQEGYIYSCATMCEKLTGKDILWVSLLTNGIALYSKSLKKFVKWFQYKPETKTGIPTDFNNSLYTAPDGTLWISSSRGLVKVNAENQQFRNAELPELNGAYYNAVSGIRDDPNDNSKYWMTVCGSGIAQYDKNSDAIIKRIYFDKEGNNITYFYGERWVDNFFEDKNKILWAPSYGGATKIENGKCQFIEVKDKQGCIYSNSSYQSDDGKIWFSGKGFGYLDPYTRKTEVFRFNNPIDHKDFYFKNLLLLDDTVYAVTKYGLFSYNLHNKAFKPVNYWKNLEHPDLLKSGFAIEKIGRNLYIATSGGLVKYNPDSHISKQIAKGEITSMNIHSLKKDQQGKLWIYSTQGLFLYNPTTEKLKKFTENDGVYNTSFDPSFFFEYDGLMYLGYRMAYTRFNPKTVETNTSAAHPYITEIVMNNTVKIPTPDRKAFERQFHWNQNNFKFQFTAIEYNSPERISFSYKLVGYDHKWYLDNGNRIATYTNLPTGNYVFKVQATNSSGLVNDKYATYRFCITPAFWNTWWFRTIIFLLMVILIYTFVTRRIQNIRKKEKEKTANNKKIAELEMKTLRSRMNPHFIFNSLNSIQKFIWENKKDDASDYLSKFAKLMRMILEFSAQSTITLKEELEALNLYVELEKRRCNDNFDYKLILEKNIDLSGSRIPPLILQPFIENAIWHGLSVLENKKGILIVSINKIGNALICVIEDNGIGRNKAEEIKSHSKIARKSYGLEITEQRLKQLAGQHHFQAIQTIDLKNETGATGTKIILTVPEITEFHA
ncbi:MAG: histidine kinase [Flavobacterium sp.]|nr:histidine kinase [Flavobacterium sp.]